MSSKHSLLSSSAMSSSGTLTCVPSTPARFALTYVVATSMSIDGSMFRLLHNRFSPQAHWQQVNQGECLGRCLL